MRRGVPRREFLPSDYVHDFSSPRGRQKLKNTNIAERDLCIVASRPLRTSQSAVYPSLDRGIAGPDDCLRRVAMPPVVVPIITGPPGYSSSKHVAGRYLPTMGSFSAGESNLGEALFSEDGQ